MACFAGFINSVLSTPIFWLCHPGIVPKLVTTQAIHFSSAFRGKY